METRKTITTATLRKMKIEATPIAMVTAYDYPSAKLAEQAGADIILVGDSLGNAVLGYESTIPVTLADMLHHTKAVVRAVSACFVVTDMPFLTYHGSIDRTLQGAAKLMQEGGCKAVKMEGGQEIAAGAQACVQAGIPVMGHLGFTPQSLYRFGGYKIQGKNHAQAEKMLEDAKALERAGVFSIVLEMVTEDLAAYISSQLSIPTIGIGAGRGCDGQVLVFHDLLQYPQEQTPKRFVKPFANIGDQIKQGIADYVREVKSRAFPQQEHAFKSDDDVVQYLRESGKD